MRVQENRFRCLMISLSGPCELLVLLCFIASWTWVVVSVMLYPCMFCVALLMDLFVLCVACLWIVWLTQTIRNIFGCGGYLVVECYGEWVEMIC